MFKKLALAEAIESKSRGPYNDGQDRKIIILDWLMRWKFSTPLILTDLLQTSRPSISRTLCQMRAEGLIESVSVPHILIRKFVFPTRKGEKYIRSKINTEYIIKRSKPAKLKPDHVMHDLICQHSFVDLARDGVAFISEPECKAMVTDRLRRPDLLHKDDDDDLIFAVEVELSRKNLKDRDQMISNLASDMKEGKISHVQFLVGPEAGIENGLNISINHTQLIEYKRHNDTGKLTPKSDIWVNLEELRENHSILTNEYLNDIYYIDTEKKCARKKNK